MVKKGQDNIWKPLPICHSAAYQSMVTSLNDKGVGDHARKELKQEEIKKVVGGALVGGDSRIDEQKCSKNNNGPHEYVKTGKEDEESFFILWSRHVKEYRCIHCGRTKWEQEERSAK